MRTLLFSLLTLSISACTSSVDERAGAGNSGGGKGDGWTDSCPIEGGTEEVIEAIVQSGSCRIATGVAESCAYGSSADVAFVWEATQICSTGFADMPEEFRADYAALLERCAALYDEEGGTMSQSVSAFCELQATNAFERIFTATETVGATAYDPECPVDRTDDEAIGNAIVYAETCFAAKQVAERCQSFTNIDAEFAEKAALHCATALSDEDLALRTRLNDACDRVHSGDDTPLAHSLTSYCKLQTDVMLGTVNAVDTDPVHDPADPINQ